MSERSARTQLRRGLDRRRVSEADINYRVYVRPNGHRGLHVVRLQCNEEEMVVSGPKKTFAPGSIVPTGSHTGNPGEFILTDPPPGRRGGSVFSANFPTPTAFDAYGITSANPSTLLPGTTGQVVTLTGYGFRESPGDNFDAVVYNETTKEWEADPYVTVTGSTWTSATEVDITLDVTASAPDEYPVNIRMRRA